MTGFLGIGIGASLVGHVPGDASKRGGPGGHDLFDPRRRREQAGQVADGELDRVEHLGQGRELPELGQSPERLHAPDDRVERLTVAGGDLERARGAIERAGDEGALPGDEGADPGVDGPPGVAAIVIGRRQAAQHLERAGEPRRARGVGIRPVLGPAHQQPEFLDRLRYLFPCRRVPLPLAIAEGPRERLKSARRPGDRLLGGHERGPAQHPAGTEQIVARRRVGAGHQAVQTVEGLSGFQREEVGGAQGLIHRCRQGIKVSPPSPSAPSPPPRLASPPSPPGSRYCARY